MLNTERGREPLFPYDQELERTLRFMNQNLGINADDPNKNILAPVEVHGHLLPNDPGENQQRGQNLAPFPQEYYRGYDNIADSDGPLAFPSLPQGHIFEVTSSMIQISLLEVCFRATFLRTTTYKPKVREVCKTCVGRPHLDVIGIRVFPLSLT